MPPGSPWTLRAEGGARRRTDAAEIARAIGVLADPASAVQIQALGPHPKDDEPKLSYPFRHFGPKCYEGVIAAAPTITTDKRHYGVYLTLNPFRPDGQHACRNSAVTARRWLLIDCDPVRIGSVNATDAEKDCARELALKVMDFLTEQSWPQPVGLDSGNGWHLLYRVELDNDGLARHLCRDVIRALAKRFDNAGAVVDQATFAAKQQTKLPGTLVTKGKEEDGRPHRMAHLAFEPEEKIPVPVELMQALAAEVRKPVPSVSTPPPRCSPWNVKATVGNGVQAYCKAALRNEFARLVTCPVGSRNSTFNRSAFALGQLVQPGMLTRVQAEQELMLAAQVIGLMDAEQSKTLDTIRRGLDDGAKQPRVIPEVVQPSVNGTHASPPPVNREGGEADTKADDGPTRWTLSYEGEVLEENSPEFFCGMATRSASRPGHRLFELLSIDSILEAELPLPNWCIPGLLAEGLNLLAGSPKQGKSMMALNLALTVAGGGKALGNIQTVPGDVVYLSLEDKVRRIQARARKMIEAIGRAGGKRLVVATTWPRLDQGGLILLEKWVKRVEKPTLFIIDVLVKFRTASRDRGNQYEQDAKVLGEIKDFADAHSVTGLVLHHTRKSRGKDDASDVFETISGTMGIQGTCDGAILLQRLRNNNEAIISLTGRDDAEQQLALRFDPKTLTWTSLGSAEEHVTGKTRGRVMKYLKEMKGAPVFPKDVSDHLGDSSPETVRKILHRLFEDGFVRRRGQAWCYPGELEFAGSAVSGDEEVM